MIECEIKPILIKKIDSMIIPKDCPSRTGEILSLIDIVACIKNTLANTTNIRNTKLNPKM